LDSGSLPLNEEVSSTFSLAQLRCIFISPRRHDGHDDLHASRF
jgi:hypothetical protein